MNSVSEEQLYEGLREKFGHEEFLPGQKEVIRDILDGRHTLTILPTGTGKSLCYQLPAYLNKNNLTLVVSPLIALMEDQVGALRKKGVPATYINSSLTKEEQEREYQSVRDGNISLLYMAPEKMGTGRFWEELYGRLSDIKLMVIDEAHCISTWGHDFRPSYLVLPEIAKKLKPTVAMFTATAPPHTREDIRKVMNLPNLKEHVGPVLRENIEFGVRSYEYDEEKFEDLVKLLGEKEHPAIVYCTTPFDTELVQSRLRNKGFSSVVFHGDLMPEQKKENQYKFVDDEVPLLIGTRAFGMGIDKPNVRTIIHYHVPGSLEDYVQEAGRAGRDGKPAESLIMFLEQDISAQVRFIGISNPRSGLVERTYRKAKAYYDKFSENGREVVLERLKRVLLADCKKDEILELLTNASFAFLLEHGHIQRNGATVEVPDVEFNLPIKELNLKRDRAFKRLEVMLHYAKRGEDHTEIIHNYLNGATIDFLEEIEPLETVIERSILSSISEEARPASYCASLLAGRRNLASPDLDHQGLLPFLSESQIRFELRSLQEEGFVEPVLVRNSVLYTLTPKGAEYVTNKYGVKVDQLHLLSLKSRRDMGNAIGSWFSMVEDELRRSGSSQFRRGKIPGSRRSEWYDEFQNFLVDEFTFRGEDLTGADLLKKFSGKQKALKFEDFRQFAEFYAKVNVPPFTMPKRTKAMKKGGRPKRGL